MIIFRAALLLLIGLGLSACSSKFKTYDGPEVTQIYVLKGSREMLLMSGPKTLKRYRIGLGFAPDGDKKVEGDGRTPEGTYYIDRRNPDSRYHLSVGISYPNPYDVSEAKAMGLTPGGEIFIHGRGKFYQKGRDDWTFGCIAVKDAEIEDIYAMVKDGTPITIAP